MYFQKKNWKKTILIYIKILQNSESMYQTHSRKIMDSVLLPVAHRGCY